MRCYCCDKQLSDYEATIRSKNTMMFLDMCTTCIKETGIPIVDRKDLRTTEPIDEEDMTSYDE